MFCLKTFDEMLKDYALKIEKVGEEYEEGYTIFIPTLGVCKVFRMPVVWVSDKKMDWVVRFLPDEGGESKYCLDSHYLENFKISIDHSEVKV